MASLSLPDDADHGFQIAPMVDVVFVLLLFFMALAGANQLERRVTAQTPSEGSVLDEVPIVLDLADDGTVSVNGTAVVGPRDADVAGLGAWLAQYRESIGVDTPFVIRPHNDARHERVVQVLGSVRKAGHGKVAFR